MRSVQCSFAAHRPIAGICGRGVPHFERFMGVNSPSVTPNRRLLSFKKDINLVLVLW